MYFGIKYNNSDWLQTPFVVIFMFLTLSFLLKLLEITIRKKDGKYHEHI